MPNSAEVLAKVSSRSLNSAVVVRLFSRSNANVTGPRGGWRSRRPRGPEALQARCDCRPRLCGRPSDPPGESLRV
jgi:hypothetical protein